MIKNEIIKTELNVINNRISIMRVNNTDYICLTDLARYKNKSNPGDVIIKWMSNKTSFDFYIYGKIYLMEILNQRNLARLKTIQ